MIYLNGRDIMRLVSYDEIMDAIEKAFHIYEAGDFLMPDRMHVNNGKKTLLYMPCFLKDMFGTKVITVFPDNRRINRPAIDGLMLLNDYETGEPVGILDGKLLTALRTGAVGGVGIRHTTPENVRSAGLVGAGAQGFYQLLYACKARKLDKITVYDPYVHDLSGFVGRLEEELPNIRIGTAESVHDLLECSEIVITATTSSEPVLPHDPDLLEGKHFLGIGSYKPDMREYPDVLYSIVDKVYIDTGFAMEETGDLSVPLEKKLIGEDQVETLGHYLINEKDKDEIVKNTTFFKSVGMALFDLVVAQLIYNKAIDKGVGQEIEL